MPRLDLPRGEIEASMFLDRLFKPRPAKLAGAELYASAARQARAPALYATLGVPDTREGRFELYSLHVILLLDRLKGQGEAAAETSQAVFDAYVRGLDDAFRELGVGDLSVGKKMKKLGEAFYGRLRSYEEAFAALPDCGPLEALMARTVLDGAEGDVAGLTTYALAAREALSGQSLDDLLSGTASWPSPR
jgi:cytochrome b pre-mRNA-processing protein 3